MEQHPLLQSIKIGSYHLPNRIIMAPLTRCRATEDHIPTDIMATYYQQRASAGLIIAEATYISAQSFGYMNTPGIYNSQQIQAWEKITNAVHSKNGRIFIQLWHTGRVSHSSMHPDKIKGVAPSPIAVSGDIATPVGKQPNEIPKELTIKEIEQISSDFAIAAGNAIKAGFDGVEIHGANGYLIDQFINESSNKRIDQYGGSIPNRCRFALEVISKVTKAIGSDKTGIRLSPSGNVKDMYMLDPIDTFSYLIAALNRFNLAYLHIMEPYQALEPQDKYSQYLQMGAVTPYFRKIYHGKLITNVKYNFNSGNDVIRKGWADMVSFGKLFISNPDLVERFQNDNPLNLWDRNTFYTNHAKGYIDYPFIGHQ